MTKVKQLKNVAIGTGSVLIVLWLAYSIYFQKFYQDVVFFATDGAQPIVQIIEILDYRGKELLPYLSIFFILVTLSFLFCISLSLVIKKQGKKSMVTSLCWFVLVLIITYNIINKLALLLAVLVVVAIIIMYSLVVTVNLLYFEKMNYEAGDIVQTEGPFTSITQSEECSLKLMAKRGQEFEQSPWLLKSEVYMDEGNQYYVDIYLENKLNSRN